MGVGTQDAFQRLWTPHRMAYIQGENKPTGPGADDGCPFCSIPAKSDEDGLIVRRGGLVYAVLNLYPYTGGHLMVVPYRHVADYTDLTEPETAELAALTKQAMTALRTASGAHGFNIGMNQGAVAGAGIAAHLHQHIVPRWGGDTNFMPVVGHTKVLPQLLGDTRKMLAEAWPGEVSVQGATRRMRGPLLTPTRRTRPPFAVTRPGPRAQEPPACRTSPCPRRCPQDPDRRRVHDPQYRGRGAQRVVGHEAVPPGPVRPGVPQTEGLGKAERAAEPVSSGGYQVRGARAVRRTTSSASTSGSLIFLVSQNLSSWRLPSPWPPASR